MIASALDGELHGEERAWFADGRPRMLREWRAGKPHGRWMAWDRGGQLRVEQNYDGGERHGAFRFWDAMGGPRFLWTRLSCSPTGSVSAPLACGE